MDEARYEELLERIPELLQQAHLSFLMGAGCSLCAGLPLMTGLTEAVCTKLAADKSTAGDPDKDLQLKARTLLADICTTYSGSGESNIEDYLSEIQDVLAILERQEGRGVSQPSYTSPQGKRYGAIHAKTILRDVKNAIRSTIEDSVKTLDHHRRFVRSIHRRLRSGRERSGAPINYFVLNYDTLIEDALAFERIVFSDGFVGGATAWWAPERRASDSHRGAAPEARIFKLHGSIDWIRPKGAELPMRVGPLVPKEPVLDGAEPVVIYPGEIKYRESQKDPFALLMQSFRAELRERRDHVLCTLGFSFRDEHINEEVEAALLSNAGLSVIAFLGEESLPSRLGAWVGEPATLSKVQVYGPGKVWKDGRVLALGEKAGPAAGSYEWYKFEYLASRLSGKE